MNKHIVLLAISLGLAAGSAHAAVDPVVTTALSAMASGFTDNFGPVVAGFILILVTVTAVKMAVSWFKRAAK